MTGIRSTNVALPYIPDNLSIPQFFLDGQHPIRPLRGNGIPWLIEDVSGRNVGIEEVSVTHSRHLI